MTEPQPIRDDTTTPEPPCRCRACRELGPWPRGEESPVMSSSGAPVDGAAYE